MATAESVKAKLQGLISLANNTTGKTDTDLTAAVNTLITGFGQGGEESVEITEAWQRPSNWPDLSSLGIPAPGTLYLTFDCRAAKSGIVVDFGIYSNSITGVDTRTFKRGYVNNGNFVTVEDIGWSQIIDPITLPTDEGDFVVYELTGIRGFGVRGSDVNQLSAVPLVEMYGSEYSGFDMLHVGNSYTFAISPRTKSLKIYNREFGGALFSYTYPPSYCAIEYMNADEWTLKSSVTSLGRAFQKMSHLKKLKLPFNTSAVTNMQQMFTSDFSLEEVDVSTFDTTNVTNMSDMFRYCYSLRTLDLSNFNTGSVTSFNYMFGACYSLYDLDFSGLDTSSVSATSTITMFDDCPNLEHLKVGNITVNFKFNKCNKLSHDSLMNVINALAETDSTLTLTIGSTNIAKLTEAEIAIATEKGWTVV